MPETIEEKVEEEMEEKIDDEEIKIVIAQDSDSEKKSQKIKEIQKQKTNEKKKKETKKENQGDLITQIKEKIKNVGEVKSRRNVFVLPKQEARNSSVPRNMEQNYRSSQSNDKKLRIINKTEIRKSISSQNLFRSLTRSSQSGGAHSLKIIKTIIQSKQDFSTVNNIHLNRSEKKNERDQQIPTIVEVPKQQLKKLKDQKSPQAQNIIMERRKLTKKAQNAREDIKIKKRKLNIGKVKSVSKKNIKADRGMTKREKLKVDSKRTKMKGSMSIGRLKKKKDSFKTNNIGHKTLNISDMQSNVVLQNLSKTKGVSVSDLIKDNENLKDIKKKKTKKKTKKKKSKYDKSIGFSFRKKKS